MKSREELCAEYDDRTVMAEYLFWNYSHLLSERVQGLQRAWQIEERAKHASPKMASMMRKKFVGFLDSASLKELEDVPELKHKMLNRVLRESSEKFIILRCPQCSRIVATPRAKQCLWCGHDWH